MGLLIKLCFNLSSPQRLLATMWHLWRANPYKTEKFQFW